jgi:hypothetical protein
MSESSLNPGIDDKKRFEVLLDGLKDAYKEIIDTNFKVSTILLAVLAWFVSSKNPLGMLCMSRVLTYFSLAFAAFGWVMLNYLFYLLYRRAAHAYGRLTVLRYDVDLFGRYQVTRGMYLCGIFGHFTMLLGVLTSIYLRYVDNYSITCHL